MPLRSIVLLIALACLMPGAVAQTGGQGAPSPQTIADIQSMLAELGYRPGPADGVMGERTRSAIRRYQVSAGLLVDGEPSMRLRQALRVATGRDPAPGAAGGRQAAWTGSAISNLTLYSRPSASHATARVLPAGTAVDVFSRRGEWLEIRTRDGKGLEGWVSYAGVRRVDTGERTAAHGAGGAPGAQPPPASSGGFFSNLARGVTKLLGGTSAGVQQQGTVTVGVRGLAAEDLASARPDHAELEKMERYRASRDQAYQFASRARLAARTVDYLPESSRAGAATPPAGAGAGRD